ncbi:MAG: TrmB family transcriptional regulator [Candidatus Nanoarchaeia archaeon]
MEDVLDKLREAGLTGNEAKVYFELLRKGELSANEVAKKISMDRTLTYTVLNHLSEKGMVSSINRNSKKFFSAANPENLLNPVKKQEFFIQDLVSQLKKIEKINDVEQEINVYEGKEGLRTFLKELSQAKEVLSFGATGNMFNVLYEAPHIKKEFEKLKMRGRLIYSTKRNISKIKGVENRLLEMKSEATTSIFGDKVATHIAKDKPIIIIIKNKVIADSYRAHFEVLWKAAKPIK